MYLVCKYIYDSGTSKSILFAFALPEMAYNVVDKLRKQQELKEQIHRLLRNEYRTFKQSFFSTLTKNQYSPEQLKQVLTQHWKETATVLVKEQYGDFAVSLLEAEIVRNINFMFGMEEYPMIRYETEHVNVLNNDDFSLLDVEEVFIF